MSDDVVQILAPTQLRDIFWLTHGGRFEQAFREPGNRAILLNLSHLTWADPVPLLSLACLCAEFRERGGALTIDLGGPNDASHAFRIFFAQHGFLFAIAKDSEVLWCGRTYSPAAHSILDAELRSLAGALAYQDAEGIPARLLPLSQMTQHDGHLADLVEELVDIAHPRISSWLPGNSRRRGLMTHQLRIFLSEALDNIHEHAYRAGTGYGAIYARIRAGMPEEAKALRSWSLAKRDEGEDCPTLARCRAGKRPGWLELFIVDAGVGITHDFPHEKSPLLKLSNALFHKPLSREIDRAKLGKTNMTGLQRIGKLLLAGRDHNNRGDFVRVYSAGEWIGEHLPWPRKRLPGYRNVQRSEGAAFPSGTVLHFALEPPPATATEQATLYPAAFYSPVPDDLKEVRSELARERSRGIAGAAFCDVYRAPEQTFAHALEDLKSDALPRSRAVFVRPSLIQRKTDLVSEVRAILERGDVADLAYVDVPWSSAIDFFNIISSQSSWQRVPADARLRIHILSQDWFCATLIFDPQRKIFARSRRDAKQFLVAQAERPSAAQAAAILRRQDSLLFWDKAGDAYLNEPVIWESGADGRRVVITGYLDLNFALAKPVIHDIVRRAMRRTISSFGFGTVHAADDIIGRVLSSDFELSNPHPAKQQSDLPAVLAGSILGSGTTVARFERGSHVPYVGLVQILRHRDFAARGSPRDLLALDWLAPKEASGARPTLFERVANTPYIIRGGEAAVPLARFRKPESEGAPQISLYAESPNEAYQRWQRLGLLRLGHWTYGGHHDLLTLRLGDALVYDSAEGGILINWLAAQINDWIPERSGSRAGFVVYAQHAVTSELARALSAHPVCRGVSFYPAASPSSEGKAALLLSPMTREAIIDECQSLLAAGGAAVILDDAVIGGVTMRSIHQVIGGLWETLRELGRVETKAKLRINSLAIVDRSGQPAQRVLVERELARNRRYWRWDVPSLGHGGTCPLCGLHVRWKALRPTIHGSMLLERLDQWLERWAALPVEEGRFDAGVPARRLAVQSSTRFGIERSGEAHRVTHSLSVSRVSIAAEIASATTRKDYPLRKAREALQDPGSLDAETALEIVATQLLLSQDQLSPADRLDRLEVLLDLLWACPEASISTALAGMVTLLDQQLVDEVWSHCVSLIDSGFPNEDTILVALAVFQMSSNAPNAPLLAGTPWEVFDLCRRSSSEERQALAMILRVFGWSLNSVHRTTLPDRLSKIDPSDAELAQAVLMLERLADAFDGMPQMAIDGSLLSPQDDARVVHSLAQRISDARVSAKDLRDPKLASSRVEVRALLDEAWTTLFSSSEGLHGRYREELCASLTGADAAANILSPAWRIVLDRWDTFVPGKGADYEKKWQNRPAIWFEPHIEGGGPIDVYFDATIRGAVADLMSNVVHRDRAIACPWPNGPDIPYADLWGRVRIGDDGLSAHIELVNGCPGTTNAQIKPTSNLVHLRSLLGDFKTMVDEQNGLMFTTIILPSAAGLTAS